MANTDKALQPGTILHSPHRDYTILRTLGAGGFGITYLVQGKIDNVTCYFAVKEHFMSSLCERGGTQDVCYSAPVRETVQSALKDFIAEAGRLNKQDIRHPNIVGINEVFEANNTAYYVMEFIPGKNVRQYVGEANGGVLPESKVLEIITPVLDALALMHSASITHLDMKPDNILLATDPLTGQLRPVIIDFGLSKHYDAQGRPTSTINMAGCSEGYSPVEQYVGLNEFSPRADVYSVAATMYFMLTGHAPLIASEMTSERVYSDLCHLCSQKMATALAHAMTPDKNFRTPSIGSFAKELGITLPGSRTPRQSYGGGVPRQPRPEVRIDRGAAPVVTPVREEATPIDVPEVTPRVAPAVPPRPEKVGISAPRVTPKPAPATPSHPTVTPRPAPGHPEAVNTPKYPGHNPSGAPATRMQSGPVGGGNTPPPGGSNAAATRMQPGPVGGGNTPPPVGSSAGATRIQSGPVGGGRTPNPPTPPTGGGGYNGPSPDQPKKRNKMIVTVILVAVALVVLILLFVMSILGDSDNDAYTDSESVYVYEEVVEEVLDTVDMIDTVEVVDSAYAYTPKVEKVKTTGQNHLASNSKVRRERKAPENSKNNIKGGGDNGPAVEEPAPAPAPEPKTTTIISSASIVQDVTVTKSRR